MNELARIGYPIAGRIHHVRTGDNDIVARSHVELIRQHYIVVRVIACIFEVSHRRSIRRLDLRLGELALNGIALAIKRIHIDCTISSYSDRTGYEMPNWSIDIPFGINITSERWRNSTYKTFTGLNGHRIAGRINRVGSYCQAIATLRNIKYEVDIAIVIILSSNSSLIRAIYIVRITGEVLRKCVCSIVVKRCSVSTDIREDILLSVGSGNKG